MSISSISKRRFYCFFIVFFMVLANKLFAIEHSFIRYVVEKTAEVKSGDALIEGQKVHASTILDPIGEKVVPRVCRALEKEKLIESRLKPVAKIVLTEAAENSGNPLHWNIVHTPVTAAEKECVVCGKISRKHLITFSDEKHDVKQFDLFSEFYRQIPFPRKGNSAERWQILQSFHNPSSKNPGGIALSFWVGYILNGLGLCDYSDYAFHGPIALLVIDSLATTKIIANDCFGADVESVKVLLLDRNPLTYRSKKRKAGGDDKVRTMLCELGDESIELEASHFEFLGFELTEASKGASASGSSHVVWDLWGDHQSIVSKIEKKNFMTAKRKELHDLLKRGFRSESKKPSKLARDDREPEIPEIVGNTTPSITIISEGDGTPVGGSNVVEDESRVVVQGAGVFLQDVLNEAAALVLSESDGETTRSVREVINKSLQDFVWQEYQAVINAAQEQ